MKLDPQHLSFTPYTITQKLAQLSVLMGPACFHELVDCWKCWREVIVMRSMASSLHG